MKKIYLAVFLACSLGGAVHAQRSEGGIPWSMSVKSEAIAAQTVPGVRLAPPAYEALAKQDNEDAINGVAKPFRVAKLVGSDIDINKSGSFAYLSDGRKIWRVSIYVPEAQALDLFYDKFQLPQGVRLFASNDNGRQIIGAYTYKNNADNGLFTNEPVQGNKINLEMDIDAGVELSSIKMHIDRVGVYYRGVEDLKVYASDADPVEAKPTLSECHVNAICAPGSTYPVQMEATAKIFVLSTDGSQGFCSGSLINNTSGNCAPLFLTASHCDGDNSFTDDHYSQWKFRFRFETTGCDNTTVRTDGDMITGATFKARSFYPSFPSGGTGFSSKMVGDFLLLQLSSMPSYANLAGWNRLADIYDIDLYPDYDFYIGFHHPRGEVKKLLVGYAIDPTGDFNQTQVNNTHWKITAAIGGMEPGSSGSPLFDKSGLIIGDLSGGTETSGNCAPISFNSLYSKMNYAWNNDFDNTKPDYGAKYRLKDHLDPTNSGLLRLGAVNSSCQPVGTPVGIKDLQRELDNAISIYPNPSSGNVNLKVNLNKPTDLKVEVYNILGAKQGEYSINQARSGDFSINMSTFSNGIYLLKIVANDVKVDRKVVLSR
jgi:lysyl endopeptidase